MPGFIAVAKDPASIDAAVGERTAAVLLEPIQGESGVQIVGDEVLIAARAACDRSGAALIFDEVQTGMGRTGTIWAYEQTRVVPDALTSAKALGGGPADRRARHRPAARRHDAARRPRLDLRGRPGRLRGGARRAGDLLGRRRCSRRVRELGERLRRALAELPVRRARPRARPDRRDRRRPDVTRAPELARRALLEQRLVVNATGPATIRLEPPLIVTAAEIDDAVARLGKLA